ncbi:hypothetical protein [Enterococcus cecorum]|uniref:Uncharacterized protein n=1 Tax=Enterococcus cecorum TaxID=44008 RepID=A0A366SRT8_9ENTE|nr:hypothetical protein [Enterococcus cecorum]RBR30795.1 hypothetical protein EB18_00806 [Enterococcus cecorum]RBR32762.1 hypothetical protein EB08_00105 [Enterococcus cecorum]RBR32990.1 hypothetical protein EB06_00973 [Enterococcus cecorum]RBR37438.1 hypothetical protein EB26_00425 [Enterococcus cecorum]RBR39222.1 hypothetical protein EB31_00107 [Enterococcus cecorum]
MQFLKLFFIYRWYALVFAFMYVALIYLICRKTKLVKAGIIYSIVTEIIFIGSLLYFYFRLSQPSTVSRMPIFEQYYNIVILSWFVFYIPLVLLATYRLFLWIRQRLHLALQIILTVSYIITVVGIGYFGLIVHVLLFYGFAP